MKRLYIDVNGRLILEPTKGQEPMYVFGMARYVEEFDMKGTKTVHGMVTSSPQYYWELHTRPL